MIKMRILQRFIKNDILFSSLISISVRVLGALSAFLLSVLIGRALGANSAGYFFLAFSIVTFLAALTRIGFDNTIVRFIGAGLVDKEWTTIRSVLNRSLLITSFASSVTAFLLYLSSEWIAVHLFSKPLLAPVLQAVAPGIVGLALLTLFAMALQGLHKVVPSVFIINISINIWIVLGLVLFQLNTAESLASAYSISSLITVIIGGALWLCFIKPKQGANTVSWDLLFASCLPLWVVIIMSQLTQWSGQFIAGVYVPSTEVAQLAAAQRTAMLTSFILMGVNLVVAPRFAALYKQGDLQGLERLALMSVKVMVVFSLPIVAVMMIFPSFLLSLFGEDFTNGGHLLQILVVGQFVNVVTGSVAFLLAMSGHEKDLRNTVLVSGPIAICAAFLLVPIYGAVGSAFSTSLAVAAQNIIAVYWVRKRLGFNMFAVWKK